MHEEKEELRAPVLTTNREKSVVSMILYCELVVYCSNNPMTYFGFH